MRISKSVLKILSTLLIISMFMSSISVFADSLSNGAGGGGNSNTSGNGKAGYSWSGGQFLRISLFMAPRGEGVEGVKDINWNGDEVDQVGKTIDITIDDISGVVYRSKDFIIPNVSVMDLY